MSQTNPKYKRLEALLSEARPVGPDPIRAPEGAEVERLKAQVNELEAKLVELEPAQNAPAMEPARKTTAELRQARPPKEDDAGRDDMEEASAGLQRQLALWAAGIFAVLGFALLLFWCYNIFYRQQGRLDFSDKVLLPVTILMLVAGVAGYLLIRRDRLVAGLWVVFGIVLVPPVAVTLVLQNVFPVTVSFLIIFASILIVWVLPGSFRRLAMLATVVSSLLIAGIEIWQPAFRVGSPPLSASGPYFIAVSGLTLVAMLIRQAWSGNIRIKFITSFTIVAVLSLIIAGAVTYFSFRSQVRENFRQRSVNMVNIAALQQDGDLHASIQNPGDEETDAYKKMQAINKAIVATEPEVAYLYTMRMNEQGQIHFFVDAGQPGDDDLAAVAEYYEEPTPLMVASFPTLDHAVAEEEFSTDKWGTWLSAYAPFYNSRGEREGILGIDIAADTVLDRERDVLYLILGTNFVVLVLVTVIGLFLGNLFMVPIVNLSIVAKKITEGDLSTRAKIETSDEVGDLAKDFNLMTTQLQGLVGSLEQRVADRTHDLELASEVGRAVTEKVADINEMLSSSAETIRARFNLYYTQVYLTDLKKLKLILRAGTGQVGAELLNRGHSLTIDAHSLNGRAVLRKKPIIVEDTLHDPNFKPNPLLPDTRSEMAVPLIAGGEVIGVLDMQSNRGGTLNESNLPAFEALAGQMAIAIQNAQLFAETAQARAEIESQAKFLTRSGWMDYMNAIHKPERTAFAFDQNQIIPWEESDASAISGANAVSAPIEITGETVGSFTVELEPGKWSESAREMVQTVAQQVARQVENLRLLDIAERYRAEAESITRRLTQEGWKEYSSTLGKESLGFAYDLEKVTPLEENGHQATDQAVAVPLSVRDEAIGQLVVDQAMSADETRNIVEAVASQLSSHIENLRLSEQNARRAAELETAVNRLRELDRLKSSFLANMSHELRTPLNSILGFADVILEELDGPLTKTMQNDLGLIQKNGQHLLHLINDVLDMAKIEAGRMNLNPEKFRVHEILDEVTSITSPLASEKNLSLFIEPDSDREVEITADRTRLRQVMINLVNNSIKFTEKGKISLSAVHNDGHVLIAVKDTGMGIPADKLEEVFTEFAQVDTSSTRKTGGTGLGLPISRKLIEMHGGRLWAESSGVANEGSTFFVELPIEAHLTESAEKVTR